MAQYWLEPIGSEFSNKDVKKLGELFTSRAGEGWRLHSVFYVTQPGCLGIGRGTTTYLAVYIRE